MDNKKIAIERYELQQQQAIKKATRHFYFLIFMNILLAVPTIFEPGALPRGICNTVIGVTLSALVFFGIRFADNIWVILSAVQLFYYFFHLGTYLSPNYPMIWFLLICARCAFCLYSGWAFLLSYDIQDVVRERQKMFYNTKK